MIEYVQPTTDMYLIREDTYKCVDCGFVFSEYVAPSEWGNSIEVALAAKLERLMRDSLLK